MTEQLSLTYRDRAIAKVEQSNEGLVSKAVDYVRFAAPRLGTFTTDDLFDASEWAFTDGRALGAVMKKAAKLGYIKATDQYRKSNQPRCHARPKRVWLANSPR